MICSIVPLLAYPEDESTLRTAHEIYRKYDKLAQAMTLAIRLNDVALINENFEAANDFALKKQLAFLVARQGICIDSVDEEIAECLDNARLSEHFLALGKELNILDPKTPDDIYKSHLENSRGAGASVDSAKQNLANSFVNSFANAGFTTDKLMLTEEDRNSWVYKNKDAGMLSATASIGMIHQWNVEGGLSVIDKFMEAEDDWIKVYPVVLIFEVFLTAVSRLEQLSLLESSTLVCGLSRTRPWLCLPMTPIFTAKCTRSEPVPSWDLVWLTPEPRRRTLRST